MGKAFSVFFLLIEIILISFFVIDNYFVSLRQIFKIDGI